MIRRAGTGAGDQVAGHQIGDALTHCHHFPRDGVAHVPAGVIHLAVGQPARSGRRHGHVHGIHCHLRGAGVRVGDHHGDLPRRAGIENQVVLEAAGIECLRAQPGLAALVQDADGDRAGMHVAGDPDQRDEAFRHREFAGHDLIPRGGIVGRDVEAAILGGELRGVGLGPLQVAGADHWCERLWLCRLQLGQLTAGDRGQPPGRLLGIAP